MISDYVLRRRIFTDNNPIMKQEPDFIVHKWMQPFEAECELDTSNPKAFVFWLMKGKSQGFDTIDAEHISIISDKGKVWFSTIFIL